MARGRTAFAASRAPVLDLERGSPGIPDLDRLIHERIRLGIVSALPRIRRSVSTI